MAKEAPALDLLEKVENIECKDVHRTHRKGPV
jgi:hypothetical protein